ncbi:hypothetical protein [Hyphomonas pacifica]|uniref:Terminase small subunit n=1 Tax=Hyphomonas pacifica TaxID=1280941 RepID=A0A8B2PFQ4_9PROT|nr:hypothetical protein [Hyphomonas pacifica]RAN30645.1 hypothetical protein HY3_05705 [Hyphomonas pacifica]
MADQSDLMSIKACADALSAAGDKLSRQALSKYCDQYELKKTRRGRVVVSFSEVQAHRAKNYTREIMSGGKKIPSIPRASTASRPDTQEAGDVVQISAAHRLKEAQAETAELDLAQKRDQLVLIDEVTAGISDTIVTFRQQLFQAIPDAAQQLAAELRLPNEEERLIRAAMKAMIREGLDGFVRAVANQNAHLSGSGSEARERERIDALSVMAAKLRARPERYIGLLKERYG